MEKTAIDDAPNEPNPLGVNSVRRSLSEALGTEDVSLAFYELDPGEQFSGGFHTHHDQEEVFYVVDGTATFEVGPAPDDEAEPDPDDPAEIEVEAADLVALRAAGNTWLSLATVAERTVEAAEGDG